jgi:hypothetical protein
VPKAELRKRAIAKLKKAIADGKSNVAKLRKRLEDQYGIKLPKIQDLPKPPSSPQVPTPTFPTPGGGGTPSAPSLPSVPNVSTTGPLLDYLFAP